MFRRREIRFATLAAIILGELFCSSASYGASQSSLAWQTNLESAKQLAAQSNRLILVHFWSPSCGPCKQLEKNVFSQAQVQQAVQARFVPVKINADDWPTTTKQYGITALPTDLIITPSGQIVGRMVSPSTPDAYLQQLAIAASGTPAVATANPAPYGATPQMGAAPTGMPAMTAAAPVAAAPPAGGWMPAASAPPSNPAMSTPAPNTATAAAPNVGWGSASSTKPSAPAISAYSDNRYAEYYQRFSPASTGSTVATSPAPNAVAATAPPATAPSTYSPAYSAPAAAGPAYTPPAVYTPQSPYGVPANTAAPAAPRMPSAQPYLPQSNTTAGASTAVAATAPPVAAAKNASIPAIPTMPAVTQGTPVAASIPATPPLAMDGYCPVTLAEEQRWQLGDRRYGVVHRGRTYLFSGPEQQRRFLANPDHFSPAISGEDVVMALDHGQEVEGKRALGVQYENRVYLFSNDASRQAFSQNPKRYAAEVLQAEAPTQNMMR